MRVLIVDQQPAYRNELARRVRQRPEFEVVGAIHGADLLAAIDRFRPAVLVVDVAHAGIDEAGVLALTGVRVAVLFLAAEAKPATVYAAIAGGAEGYMLKSSAEDEICEAIARIGRGKNSISPAAAAALVGEMRLREHGPPVVLPARQQEVLRLLAAGLKAPQIAARLGTSVRTDAPTSNGFTTTSRSKTARLPSPRGSS